MQTTSSRMRYRRFVARVSLWADEHLNFYRVHLVAFTFIPLISAAIFYASNGSTKVSYLDSLFMCASAMTTSGLNTINLSTTTVWQQVILAFLMFIGNSTTISLVVLHVRKSYFKSRCIDAVRMARQRRRERSLITPKQHAPGSGTRVFERMRTRAQTLLGMEHPHAVPEAQEDGLGSNEKVVIEHEEKRTRIKGRVRGETIAMSMHGGSGSDEEDDDGKHSFGSRNARTDASSDTNVNGHEHHKNEHRANVDRHVNDNANGQLRGHSNSSVSSTPPSVPPMVTETAPTPPPNLVVLPELRDHDPYPTSTLSSDAPTYTRPRPRSLALGHEPDRHTWRPRERSGTIRVGDMGMLESEVPEEDEEIEKEGNDIEEKNKSSRDSPPTTTPDFPSSRNGTTQFATSTLSPRVAALSTSSNEVSEFRPEGSPGRKHNVLDSPASHNGTLYSPSPKHVTLSPTLRRGTLSTASPASHKATLSPAVRPAFLHPVSVPPRRRMTTFADQVHPLHPHEHSHDRAAINGDGHGVHGHAHGHGHALHARRTILRARNGTITSPMNPYAQLHPHTSTHSEGSSTTSPSSNGTDLQSPPPAHPRDVHPSPFSHVPHLAHTSPGYLHAPNLLALGHPQYRRPRAQTGQGDLPSPLELAARWGVNHVPALGRFVAEHEKEFVKEVEGRVRRGSVYMRMESDVGHGAGGTPIPHVDDGSLEEDLEKMGGDEYNALVVLSWIVAGHYFLHHIIAFVILAPYSAKIPVVRDVIRAQNESSGRNLNTTWFALFTVISAYANAGLTVVDTSLIQMSNAYVLIFAIIWLILVGATAFPLSLRFFVWLGTKIVRRGNTLRGLKFLLRHPRRCFMYLFPSHQSWYLLFTLVAIFLIDWIAYLTFNIGMPGIESLPTGPRVVGGLLQAAGQRAGGFTTINLAATAPALQVLYIATMFVQVYPIAMAVRTSNVYEDSGMVIYGDEKDAAEPTDLPSGRGAGFTAYVGWHLKQQLAQDLFWLVAALTTLCAFERTKILDDSTSYFNIFSLFFEIVSAFANVGFSLGVSSQPYSLSGEFRTIPKLIIIGLMLRGRHRGLPMAIDRAVQLPTEYKTTSAETTPTGTSSRRSTVAMSRRATVGTYTRTSVRQRQRAQDPTLSSDEDD